MQPIKLAIPATLIAAMTFSTAASAALISPGNASWRDAAVANRWHSGKRLKTVRPGRDECKSTHASKARPALRIFGHVVAQPPKARGRAGKASVAAASCAPGSTPVVIADPTDTLSPGNPPPLTIVFGPDIFDGTGGPPDAGPGNQEPSQGTPNPTNPPDDHAANGGGGGSAPETDTPQHGHGNPPGNLPPIDLEEIAQGPFGPFEVDIPGPEWHCTAGIGACSEGGPGVGGNGTPGNPMAPMGQWPNPAGRPAFAPMMPAAAPQQEANVPEPASLTLFGLGLVAIGYQRRKRAAS